MCAVEQSYRTWGSWKDVTNRYLGLKLVIKGKIHYGWAQLSVTVHKQAHIRVRPNV
jgi:hypothetical protein